MEAAMPETTRTAPSLTDGSLVVRVVMRPMTSVFNPLLRRLAGRRHFTMAAEVHHRGRVSGRSYVTPASARIADGVCWVPLTFGTGSDWCQNVRAAGGCTVRWKGVGYVLADPVVVDRARALAAARGAFRRRERVMLRVIGIREFLRLDIADVPDPEE
jgi:hypothetical protein